MSLLIFTPTNTVEAASTYRIVKQNVCSNRKVYSKSSGYTKFRIVKQCRLVSKRIYNVQKPSVDVAVAKIDFSKEALKAQAKAYLESKGQGQHWSAFDFIMAKESGWNPNARNKKSGACGLAQALPCSKTLKTHPDYNTNPMSQVDWALNYMNARYGSPSGAYSFWQKNHWY